MEYIHAAMLLHKVGKSITEESVRKVLEAAGVKPDEAKLKFLVSALSGLDIEKAIAEASASLVAAPASASTTPSATAPAEAKKVEKKEEAKSETQAAAGLSALFG